MKMYLAIAVAALLLLLSIAVLKGQRDSLALQLEMTQTAVTELEQAALKSKSLLASRDAVDLKYTEELKNAKRENDQLRAAVADGTKRLRVKATCPVVSGSTGAASVDDGAEPELDPAAREDYLQLRERIVGTEKRLAGLQAYVKGVCLAGGADE
jgi:prophage endopeptidase